MNFYKLAATIDDVMNSRYYGSGAETGRFDNGWHNGVYEIGTGGGFYNPETPQPGDVGGLGSWRPIYGEANRRARGEAGGDGGYIMGSTRQTNPDGSISIHSLSQRGYGGRPVGPTDVMTHNIDKGVPEAAWRSAQAWLDGATRRSLTSGPAPTGQRLPITRPTGGSGVDPKDTSELAKAQRMKYNYEANGFAAPQSVTDTIAKHTPVAPAPGAVAAAPKPAGPQSNGAATPPTNNGGKQAQPPATGNG